MVKIHVPYHLHTIIAKYVTLRREFPNFRIFCTPPPIPRGADSRLAVPGGNVDQRHP